jgi:hypothetical protein
VSNKMIDEYRAVFENPWGTSGSKGPVRKSLIEAMKELPERSEETFERLVGIQHRQVSEWVAVPLSVIREEKL